MPDALEVMGMGSEQFQNEKLYQGSLSIAKSLLKNGLISHEEYTKVEEYLLKKYRPIFGALFAHGR